MISICSLIYQSTQYADAIWESIHENTPELQSRAARFFFVANDPTEELLAHLVKKGYSHVVQRNKRYNIDELKNLGYAQPEYIHRVYRGWNRAIMESEEQLVLVNSDMLFSPGWLEGLNRIWNSDRIVTSRLVERVRDGTVWAYMPDRPAPYAGNFGDHPLRFKKAEFLEFAASAKRREQEPGSVFSPCMMSRSKAIQAGLFPEGNMYSAPPEVWSGDRIFFNRMANIGVEHLDSLDSIVYHFKEGELNAGERTNYVDMSFVIPCELDRLNMFKDTYRAYMSFGIPDNVRYEFILVSRTIKEADLSPSRLDNVRVVNYEFTGPFFNPSMAFNKGVVAAKYNNVIITSPEVSPLTNVIKQLSELPRNNYICQTFDQRQDGSISESLVNTQHRGHIPAMYFLAMFKKEDILTINGWDEGFMAGSSWEDIDFGERFARALIPWVVLDKVQAVHKYHPRNYENPGWDINWAVLAQNIKDSAIYTPRGIKK